jgi:hypothetical protein
MWTVLNYTLVAISVLGALFMITWTSPLWRHFPGAWIGLLFGVYLFAGPVCAFLCPALMLASGQTHTERGPVFFGLNTIGFFSGLAAFWAWRNLNDLFGASC